MATKSGELTFKQAGIMLVVAAAVIIGAQLGSHSAWSWSGVPVMYIAAAFGAIGVVLTVVGIVKKA